MHLPLPQVEERLRFYEEGVAPKKNITAMQEAMKALGDAAGDDEPRTAKKVRHKLAAEAALAT